MSDHIPQELLHQVYRHARAVFPAECCGWLAGPRGGGITRVRPCRNAQADGGNPLAAARGAETAYVIDGDELLELARGLDGPEPPQVIYHSHPNGRAYFSEVDQGVARDPWGEGPMYPVRQLVVGLDGKRVVEARLYAWADGRFAEIARFPGAEL